LIRRADHCCSQARRKEAEEKRKAEAEAKKQEAEAKRKEAEEKKRAEDEKRKHRRLDLMSRYRAFLQGHLAAACESSTPAGESQEIS
jgi:membrane protein involved in colicin uptake